MKDLMGNYVPSFKDTAAMLECHKNSIRIYPVPTTRGNNPKRWFAEVELANGNKHRSPDSYGFGEIWEKIYEFYSFYQQ